MEGKAGGTGPEGESSRAAGEGGTLKGSSSKVRETWHRLLTCVLECIRKANEWRGRSDLLSVALDVADACACYYTGGKHGLLRASCVTVMRDVMGSQLQRQSSVYCFKCEVVEGQQREGITRLRAEISELLRQINRELVNAKERAVCQQAHQVAKWARLVWGGITKLARHAWDYASACIGYILSGG